MAFTNDERGVDAETRATLLANAAGLRPSGFTRDVHGADCYVELPFFPAAAGSLASFPFAAVPSLIQVKGTIRSRYSVTLSVWKKLACAPQPAFFLVFEYADEDAIEPDAVYLVHVDEALVQQVVRRCWELAEDPAESLAHHHLDLPWGPEHRLEAPPHEALRMRMLAAVGDAAYPKRKVDWALAAGKEKRALTVTLAMRGTPDELAPQLAEFAVGLRPQLRIDSMRGAATRFGIARPDPRLVGGDGVLEWPHERAPSLPCTATVRHTSTGDEIALAGELRSSHLVFHWLAPEHFIVRFVHPHLDLTIRFGGVDADLSFDIPAGQTPLGPLAAAGRAFELLGRGGCEVCFEMPGSPVHRQPLVRVVNALQFSPVVRDVLAGAVHARSIARYVDAPDDAAIAPDDLLESLPLLNRAAMFVNPTVGRIDFSLTLESSVVGERIAVFLPHWLAIGSEIVVVHGAFVGLAATVVPEPDGVRVRVEVSDARPRLVLARRLTRDAAEATADGLVEDAIHSMSSATWGDLRIIEPPGDAGQAWPMYRARVFRSLVETTRGS